MTWGSNPSGWYTCSKCKQRVLDGKDGDIEAHNAVCASPTAPELNQGKELTREGLRARIKEYLCSGGLFNPELMEHDKVRDLLYDCCLFLCRSSEAPSRRGEGEKPLPFKLPVRKYVNRDIEQWGNYGIVDDRDGEVAFCDFEKVADAIVEALNKNTGGAS